MNGGQRAIRWAEMLALFVGGPVVLTVFPGVLGGGRLFAFLWVCAGACLVYLFRDASFERRRLWGFRAAANGLGWVVFRWVLLGVLVVFVYGLFSGRVFFGLRIPVELFGLPRRIPRLWFMIAVLYPWVSVYPQNVIYRGFFCRRYGPILGGGWAMIGVNAALFSFGHFMFGNWIVLALTFCGGLMFTWTYLRSESLLLSVVEHSLYGLLCFSIGIGIYLLYGAAG